MAKTRSVSKRERCQDVKTAKKRSAKTCKIERQSLSRRRAYSELPQLGAHLTWIFAGSSEQQKTLLTIHTSKIPVPTQAVLNSTLVGYYSVECEADIVDIWRHFLYTGELFFGQDNDVDDWQWLADMYILGVYLKDERFCNAVIDAMIDKQFKTGEYPNNLASPVWGETKPGDKLRDLIVDFHVWAGLGIIKSDDRYCEATGFQSAVRRRTSVHAGQLHDNAVEYPWAQNCRYHKHADTERCPQAWAD